MHATDTNTNTTNTTTTTTPTSETITFKPLSRHIDIAAWKTAADSDIASAYKAKNASQLLAMRIAYRGLELALTGSDGNWLTLVGEFKGNKAPDRRGALALTSVGKELPRKPLHSSTIEDALTMLAMLTSVAMSDLVPEKKERVKSTALTCTQKLDAIKKVAFDSGELSLAEIREKITAILA